MHSSSLELGRKRVKLNVCESFKYFPQNLLRKYLKKKYLFFFQKSNFTMKGASVKVAILSFFSQLAMKPLHKKKSALAEPPFLLFQTFCIISANFVL